MNKEEIKNMSDEELVTEVTNFWKNNEIDEDMIISGHLQQLDILQQELLSRLNWKEKLIKEIEEIDWNEKMRIGTSDSCYMNKKEQIIKIINKF